MRTILLGYCENYILYAMKIKQFMGFIHTHTHTHTHIYIVGPKDLSDFSIECDGKNLNKLFGQPYIFPST